MNVAILGGATSQFGELWETSPRVLAREVMQEALAAAKISPDAVGALFVGNMLSGILGGQENLGSFYAEELGITTAAMHIEAACASGGLAVHTAVNGILSGQYEVAVVLGIEKMTDHTQSDVSSALMAAGSDEERQSGVTFAGLYALIARAYMQQYGLTEKELAAVTVKNHFHGSSNTKAQFPFTVSVEQVLQGTKIADPLKLLDCSPISDGAAAVVLSSDAFAKKHTSQYVSITASSVASDTLSLHNRKSFTSLQAVVIAAQQAYKKAQVTTDMIDVAEVHDCFSIAEILAVEDLGFSKKGEGAKDIASGKYTLSSDKTIVNPSGGLKACGHPVGATGVKQIVEIMHQLQGVAGKRQVKGAQIGLTHNVAGSGSLAVIHILQNNL